MELKQVKVYAPGSISNLGPGFDVLGLALLQPGDTVFAKRVSTPGLHFHLAPTTPQPLVPKQDNVAAYVGQLILNKLNPPFGIELTLHKTMPIGSGLGSSGASSAAAAAAVNALLPTPLSPLELVPFAAEGERLASGFPHADNVAPSLLGGICLIQNYQPLRVIQLPYQDLFYWVVVHPHLTMMTKDAREALPSLIPRQTAISQCGHLAGLLYGLQTGNTDWIAASLTDFIAEPIRAKHLPGYHEVKQAALSAGAIGVALSGSGPSIFAITTSPAIAKQVAIDMQFAFSHHANVSSDSYISKINPHGAVVDEVIE